MKSFYTLLFLMSSLGMYAQSGSLQGVLQDPEGAAVEFANVVLYSTADSSMVKVETTDELGIFKMQAIPKGNYFLEASMIGFANVQKTNITITDNANVDMGVVQFIANGVELDEVTVTAQRAMVEVKTDRTVFNVQGTINSVGEDGISLLRKAPGVTIDNNDNINVLGRSGVLVYVDGKRLPLSGDDLSNYLKSLPAEQIDRIDIITNPGAKYEAQGNAGIIDIRLKRDKNHGANGTLSSTYSQGRYPMGNINASGNYRNKLVNVFGTLGAASREGFNEMNFKSYQNSLFLDETNDMRWTREGWDYRLGTDFFVHPKHTLGFLVSGRFFDGENVDHNRTTIASATNTTQVDSVLIANNTNTRTRHQNTYNINYVYEMDKEQTLNIDLDYGNYTLESYRYQPNRYYDATEQTLLTERINTIDTPTDIDIYTAKIDYEQPFVGGKLGIGAKYSQVVSDNTFLFYNNIEGALLRNDRYSNQFDYDEKVYAGYVSYARPLTEKWNASAGLRMEYTDALGNLMAFLPELQEDPVVQQYDRWFPNVGLTYTPQPNHSFSLNAGRRINRPDYNVLNPFNNQLSELSYEKGNPFLQPEIVNNVEFGYTLAYRFNFKLGYSRTEDQITRLIAPDSEDPRASFITWENLAEQEVISFNASLPFQVTPKWNAYMNFSAAHLDNQADYGDGAIVDVQAFTYSIYQQHTFDLPWKLKGEISGYYSGPGVWGGVFEYESNWSLNVGLQRKFLQDRLNVRLSANDLFYETGWDGVSSFDGLESAGSGNWDSRRAAISLSYRFGNDNVKSRKRKTGLESEGSRVGEGE